MSIERIGEATVLVTDAGGRGNVVAEMLRQSDHVGRVLVVPGNDMTRRTDGTPVDIFPNISLKDPKTIADLCDFENVDLVLPVQDDAVASGVTDELRGRGKLVDGPTQKAAELESSKAWAREFAQRHGILQPDFRVFNNEGDGIEYLNRTSDRKLWVKASGLAAGKGATSANNIQEAIQRVGEMGQFKEAGRTYLIEEWIEGDDGTAGEELSEFIKTDGQEWVLLGDAQDNKRVNNNDEGPNTGGMGCTSPPLIATTELHRDISENVIKKTLLGMQEEERPYTGDLYLGLMRINFENAIRVALVEYNARPGDPEAQVVLPAIMNDYFELCMRAATNSLKGMKIQRDGLVRVGVVGASRGYPGDYSDVAGKEIFGFDEVKRLDGVDIYGAGVKMDDEGRYYANGGRLFTLVGKGKNLLEARRNVYAGMSLIYIDGNNLHYRTDIGSRDVKRLYKGETFTLSA